MSDLYESQAGVVIKSVVTSPAFISIDGFDNAIRGGKLLMTSLRVERGQAVQVLRTLGNLYYIYAFGETPGRVMAGGLLFFNDCSGNGGSAISQVNSFFSSNNAYNRKEPISIAAGGAAFSCILTNMSISGDMTPYNYASFSLSFILMPSSGLASGNGPGRGPGGGLSGGGIQASSGIQGSGSL